MKRTRSVFALAMVGLLLSCQSQQIKTQNRNMPPNAYLDGGQSTIGVILCHGRNKYPTWRVVEPLRNGVHKALGYHMLSLQMPAVKESWREYGRLFPDAYKRIAAAIQVLRHEKGVQTVYLMGHSMGSRMATGYLAEHPESKVTGFIGVGARNRGGKPLDSLMNLKVAIKRSPGLKILDVYGDGGDGQDAKDARERAIFVGARYKQILIPGADHQFFSGEKLMVNAVITWLKEQP